MGTVSCVPDYGPGEVQEVCNGLDDDCDGFIDEGLATQAYYKDDDGDGYGTTATVEACQAPAGYVDKSGDCNDNNAEIHPGATELCNDVDDNCSGATDEGVQKPVYYKDDDGDGYGTTATVQACTPPGGYADKSGDCNDNNAEIHPGAVEQCNDVDDNCNGAPDEGLQKPVWYKDNDGDGWGGQSLVYACTAPTGYVADAGDCNDFNKNIYPAAPEQCNNVDDDCNGLVDDGVTVQTIYKDNDGDGWAPSGALSQDKCNIPVGWTVAKDANGDGTTDWDCNDSDVTVYPEAAEVCGDGKDNSCSGYVDRLCFTSCGGSWPYKAANTYGAPQTQIVDLDGDGNHEVIMQDDFAFAIVAKDGVARYEYSAPVYNYSRGLAVVADIDTYDQFGAATQTLEVLTGNGSKPRFYRMQGGTVDVLESTDTVYDASRFLAADIDHNGRTEFFTSSWCVGSQGTRVYRWDKATSSIVRVVDIPDPDNTCEYYDGRVLTDLDGDGDLDYVFGNGYAYPTSPNVWGGKIYALSFTDLTTLANTPYCDAATCFPTAVPPLYGGGIGDILRVGDQIRSSATLFETNTPNVQNASKTYFYRYDLAGQHLAGSPGTTNILYEGVTDLDDDGTPEGYSEAAWVGLFDVNGDGYPDRVRVSGTELRLDLWNATTKAFAEHVPSRVALGAANLGSLRAWDIDADGRLEVIVSDGAGKVYCEKLSQSTWNRFSSVPPHFHPFHRTYQWDAFEPNEGDDTNIDGIPDRVVQIPSALTTRGDFYGWISSATDKDYYLVDAAWGGSVCVRSTGQRRIDLKVYSFYDKWDNTTHEPGADGKVDGLIWENTSDAQSKCFSGNSVTPYRYGEYKFVIGIEPHQGSFSPHWPYWITATK